MNLGLFRPELILAGTAVAVILLDLFVERKGAAGGAQPSLGLAIAVGFTSLCGAATATGLFNDMLAVDSFALFFKLLFLGIAVLVVLASTDYVQQVCTVPGRILRPHPDSRRWA